MITDQDIIHLFNQQVRRFNKLLNDRLKVHGLYQAQWSILYCLHKNGPMTQKQITEYFHVEAPTVTRTLKRMEENDWITRTPGQDKRERLIGLTSLAKSKYKEIEQTVLEHDATVLGNLSKVEKEELYKLLDKLE